MHLSPIPLVPFVATENVHGIHACTTWKIYYYPPRTSNSLISILKLSSLRIIIIVLHLHTTT